MKEYCTQHNGECESCSLANYGKDCQNYPLWGGARTGSGRKPSGRKKVQLWITTEEELYLRIHLEKLRGK